MFNFLGRFAPRPKLFLIKDDKERRVIGPESLLESLGTGIGKVVLDESGNLTSFGIAIRYDYVSISSDSFNGVRFSDMKLEGLD